MRNSFPGYYQPTLEEFKTLWSKALFVLDANVLLNLYRYSKTTSDDFLSTLAKIKDRLWIPHQAALEFQENRLGVIAEQVRKFGEVAKIIEDVRTQASNKLGDLQLEKRHPLIDPVAFLEEIDIAATKFKKKLEELQKKQNNVSDHDQLRDAIDELFENRVGPPPNDEQALQAIYKAGKERYLKAIPPGYSDQQKEGCYSFGTLQLERQYGDLLVWEQLIAYATEKQIKNVIFVTDDSKKDWWWIVKSDGPKTQGPRPELLQEIRQRAKVECFYMYASDNFLTYAQKYLGTMVKKESIEQVRDVARTHRILFGPSRLAIQHAIESWLRLHCPEAKIIQSPTGNSFLVRREISEPIRVWFYKAAVDLEGTVRLVNKSATPGLAMGSKGIIVHKVAFIVCLTPKIALRLEEESKVLSTQFDAVFGYCSSENGILQFHAVGGSGLSYFS